MKLSGDLELQMIGQLLFQLEQQQRYRKKLLLSIDLQRFDHKNMCNLCIFHLFVMDRSRFKIAAEKISETII